MRDRRAHRAPRPATPARRLARAVSLAAALVTACAGGDPVPSPRDGSDELSVVASFYPLAVAAERVGGGGVAVENLTPPGAEPHDLELSPSEVEQLLDADVVLVMGRGFQPAVEEVAAGRDGVTLEVLDGLPLGQDGEGPGRAAAGDPHVWLDPTLMIEIVRQVEDVLVRADPGSAGDMEANAAAFVDELEALHARYQVSLSGCAQDVIVVSHDAFGWLAARYGLRQEALTGLAPEAEPDPRRLAELAELVRSQGITTIFTETLVSPEVAETLAREAGVRTAVLNPLEGITDEERASGADYLSIMDENLEVLTGALGCR